MYYILSILFLLQAVYNQCSCFDAITVSLITNGPDKNAWSQGNLHNKLMLQSYSFPFTNELIKSYYLYWSFRRLLTKNESYPIRIIDSHIALRLFSHIHFLGMQSCTTVMSLSTTAYIYQTLPAKLFYYFFNNMN